MNDMSPREVAVWAAIGITSDELRDMAQAQSEMFSRYNGPTVDMGDMLIARALNNVATAIRELATPTERASAVGQVEAEND